MKFILYVRLILIKLLLFTLTEIIIIKVENKIKPPETKALGSMTGSMTADEVAKVTLSGIERGRYMIIPGLEGKIYYHLNGLLGLGINPILDYLIADAVKKKNKSRSKEA